MKRLTGPCEQCGGSIEYAAELIGTTTRCPHCGQSTELRLPSAPEDSGISRKVIIWTLAGVLILAVGLAVLVWGLGWAERHQSRLGIRIPPDLSVSALTLEKPRSGEPAVTGTLRNHSSRERSAVRIEFDLLDASGKKVGTGCCFHPVVAPKSRAPFRVPVQQADAAKVKLFAVREGQTPAP